VLVLSLIAVAVVASLSVGYLRLSAMVTRRQVGASDTKIAFYLAEAGLAESYAGVMVGRTGKLGGKTEPAVLGEGLLWVEATRLDADHVQLESVGMARSGQARLGMVIRRGRTNVGGLGIFSEEAMTIGDGTLIDGYDSTEGDYAGQAASDPESVKLGNVGSNGNVTITSGLSGTTIHGDVSTGPAGTLTLNGSPTISGATGTALSLVMLDAVVLPETTMSAGVTQAAGAPLVVPAGTFGAQYLHLAADSEVVLQGPLVLVLGGLQIAAGAELGFDTSGGPIEIFVVNELDVDAGAVLTNTEADATKVTVNVAGDAAVHLDSAGEFHGLIFAPEATVDVGSRFELFGALIAERLSLANGATLHYDRALMAAGAREATPQVLSWRIIELPENSRDTVNVDPFVLLGVDPSTCKVPGSAHEDQMITVSYYDSGGALQTYTGLESGLDWGLVRTVVEVVRTGGLVVNDVVGLVENGALGFLLP
jgi:hypothetical protein